MPRTVAELEGSGISAETEERNQERRGKQQSQQRPTTPTKAALLVCEECEAAPTIQQPASGDTRLPQCLKAHPEKKSFRHFPTLRTGVTNSPRQNVTVAVNSAVVPPPYTNPECRMTSLPVTSVGVLFRALKRSVLFQIASVQTLVFCRYLLTRTRDLQKAMYVKLCGCVDAILQLTCRKKTFEGVKFSYPLTREMRIRLQTQRITVCALCQPQIPS